MFQKEKTFSFSLAYLLMVVLINILLIKTAYTNNPDFYWALLFSIPALGFAIYYRGTVSEKETNDRISNINAATLDGQDEVILPRKIKGNALTVLFGNSHCTQPYLSSIICFESVSADENIKFMPKQVLLSEANGYTHNMIPGLNDGLFITDSIWRIGPGYGSSRDNKFKFNAEAFRLNALRPTVKMIELKLSGFSNKDHISTGKNYYPANAYNNKDTGTNFKQIYGHTAFSNAESMAIFLDSLRQLSGKKPIGIRLCITDKKAFHEICYAFRKTGIIPDYLSIEDFTKENNLFVNSSQSCDMPLYEALLFASKTLEIYGLSKEIKIITASEVYSPFDVLRLFALGADGVSVKNHLTRKDRCFEKGDIKSTGFSQGCMEQLRSEILESTMKIMQAWGYKNVRDITLPAFFRDLGALYPKGFYKGQDQEFADSPETRSFGIVKRAYYEKNTSSETILN